LGMIEDTRAFPHLLAKLKSGEADLREAILPAIGNMGGPQVVVTLIQALKNDAKPRVRAAAAITLSRFPQADVIAALVEACRDSDADVSESAILALGNLRDRRATKPLLSLLGSGDIKNFLGDIISALGWIGDPMAVDAIAPFLRHKESDMRWLAAVALGDIGDTRALDPLLKMLGDPVEDVVAAAIRALGAIGDIRARAALDDILRNSPVQKLQDAARDALARIILRGMAQAASQASRQADLEASPTQASL